MTSLRKTKVVFALQCGVLAAVALLTYYGHIPKTTTPSDSEIQPQSRLEPEALGLMVYSTYFDKELRMGNDIVLADGLIIEVGHRYGQSYRPTSDQLKAIGMAANYSKDSMYQIEVTPTDCKADDCVINAYLLKNGQSQLVYKSDSPARSE